MVSLIDEWTQGFKLVLLFFRVLGTFIPTKSNSGTREKNNQIQRFQYGLDIVSANVTCLYFLKKLVQ